jgi:hypothetical protein
MAFLGDDILIAARAIGWDRFTRPFQPRDLKLQASDYGSFSDWCIDEGDDASGTRSGRYNPHVCLRAVGPRDQGRPVKYVLLPPSQWVR